MAPNSMSPKWMEKKGKRILGATLRAVLPSQSLSPTESDWNAVSRILLVRQDRRIGDLVMNTPLFHAVRKRFPKAHIALLLRGGYEGLYADDPCIDELLPFSTGRDFYNPAGLAGLVSRLRRGHFDLAVDCSNFRSFSLTNGLLTLLSGAPLRLGFEDKESPAFLNVTVKQGALRHYVENQLELLSPLGGGTAGAKPWLYVGGERRERARRLLASLGLDESAPKAVVFMNAGNVDKTWSRGCFLDVAARLKAAGVSVALARAPGGGAGAARSADPGDAYDRGGDLPTLPDMRIGDFAAAISCCDVFVSGDTGPMHIAAACDVSTVGVFLEDNERRYGYTDGPRFQALRVAPARGAERVADAALRAVKAARSDFAPRAD
jgi:ADP-heptose:LPS heptosyltransferase